MARPVSQQTLGDIAVKLGSDAMLAIEAEHDFPALDKDVWFSCRDRLAQRFRQALVEEYAEAFPEPMERAA